MTVWTAKWTERWRGRLLAGVEADIARLERELEAQKAALRRAEALSPLVAKLEERSARPPEELAGELRPFIEEMVRAGARAQAARRRRLLAVATVALAGGAGLVWWWQNHSALVFAHTARVLDPAPGAARVVAAPRSEAERAPDPPALVLAERGDGFGLGQASLADADLAVAVRSQLGRCSELAGAELSFAVKDGWVWLRGRAAEEARDAASRALADLGEGVVVVNQIETGGRNLVAER